MGVEVKETALVRLACVAVGGLGPSSLRARLGDAVPRVVALVTGAILSLTGLTVVAAPAWADSITTLNLTTYSQMVVDTAHKQVFIAGGPTSNWIEVRGFDGTLKSTVSGQTGASGVAVAPDGSAVYAALDGTGSVSRISTSTLTETARYALGVGTCVSSVTFAGPTLYVGYGCAAVRVAPLDLAAATPTLKPPLPGVYYRPALAGDSNGRVLALMTRNSSPGQLVRYDLTQNPVTSSSVLDGGNCMDLAVHSDGAEGIMACGSPYVHNVRKLSDLSLALSYPTTDYPNSIAVSDSMVAAGVDGSSHPDIYVFARNSETLIRSIELGGTLRPRGLALAADNSTLFAVSTSGSSLRFHTFDNPLTPPAPLVGDAAFARCITDAVGLPAQHQLTEAELGSVTSLDCSGRGIKNIAGAEKLTSLTDLALDTNQISDLAPLRGLTTLTSLTLADNQVQDLTPLTRLTGLTVLGLDNNRIEVLTPLTALAKLDWLWLDGNHISELAPLAGLRGLTWLSLERNQVNELAAVAGLTNLHALWLADNQISSVRPLVGLTELDELYLERNHLIDLAGVNSAFDLECDSCGLYASDQAVSLPQATVGVSFPLLAKDDLGEVMPLTPPAGVTYVNGALRYAAPGTYKITFGVDWFSGTLTQQVKSPVTSSTPKVSGSALVGNTLTALPGAWGPGGVALAYQWIRGSSVIDGAIGSTYAVQPADVGSALKVKVTGTADGVAAVSKTSAATAVVAKGMLTPTSAPRVSDATPVTDQLLVADPGSWGPDPVALAHQWYRVSSTGISTAISGANQASYAVKSGDVGYRLKAKVTGSKPGFMSAAKYSALTSPVASARFATVPAPVIADVGTPRVGKKLTTTPGEFIPVQSRFAYQWYRGTTAIIGATGATYALAPADKGQRVKVRVKAYRAGYTTVTQYTTPTAAVLTGLTAVIPKVSDTTPTVDQLLTANPGAWGPTAAGISFGFQWYKGSTAIPSATDPTYTVRPTDVGATLKVKVTGTAPDYANVSSTSAATSAVVKANFTTKPVPRITCPDTCLFRVGETLNASPESWQPAPDNFSYQWYRSGIAISGATQPGRTLTTTDKGKTITVMVTARKAGYNTASKTSAVSKAVTG